MVKFGLFIDLQYFESTKKKRKMVHGNAFDIYRIARSDT